MPRSTANNPAIGSDSKVYVAGHGGLVGSAIMRQLKARGHTNTVHATRAEVDLRDQAAVCEWMRAEQPDLVYLVAGTVGGIGANSTRPADFLFDNLMIHANIIEASRQVGVKKLLYLGSSCIYPRSAPQPIPEAALLTGELEPTNEAYALAKISGMKLCEYYRRQYGCDFISAMPTNLYGPNDNFDLESSHVLPALLRKFHEAKLEGGTQVEVWGSGTPLREFLHVDDLADACLFLMQNYSDSGHVNIGTGSDLSIKDLAETIRDIVYPDADIVFDADKPDGMKRKVLDVSQINALGWSASTALRNGIVSTYEWFCAQDDLRGY